MFFARNQLATANPKAEVLLEEKWKLGLNAQPLMGSDRGSLMSGKFAQSCLCLKQRHPLDVQQSRRGLWPPSQVRLLFTWPRYVASIYLSFSVGEVGVMMALNIITVRIKLEQM